MKNNMKKVGRDASVHPATLSGKIPTYDKGKARMKSANPNGRLAVTQMHDEVWATALELAGGDVTRIERISHDEVIVHNEGWKK